MKQLILTLAVAIGLFRPVLLFVDFNPHIEAGYEAAAHLFVGGLLGAWLWARTQRWAIPVKPGEMPMFYPWHYRWLIVVFWILTAIEVICAGVTVAMKRGLL